MVDEASEKTESVSSRKYSETGKKNLFHGQDRERAPSPFEKLSAAPPRIQRERRTLIGPTRDVGGVEPQKTHVGSY